MKAFRGKNDWKDTSITEQHTVIMDLSEEKDVRGFRLYAENPRQVMDWMRDELFPQLDEVFGMGTYSMHFNLSEEDLIELKSCINIVRKESQIKATEFLKAIELLNNLEKKLSI